MKLEFRGGAITLAAFQHLVIFVHFHKHRGLQFSLTYARRGSKKASVLKLYGNIPVVGGYHSPLPEIIADFANLLP